MVRALAAFICLAAASDAHAERFAIVIGANRGDPGMPVLRYAEDDARRVGEVMTRLGGVDDGHLLVTHPDSAESLRKQLDDFGGRVRAAGPGTLVVVYYSGHADAGGLLLGGTRFAFGELKRALRDAGAQVTVYLVDACRAGGLITAKGGVPIQPFDLGDLGAPAPDVSGSAILTSSAVSEDAQESERLGGGVFTHHLLAGLQGAADEQGDGRIALSELYRYAFAQTRLTTAGSPIEQHPTFAFDLHGEDDVVLTTLPSDGARALLHLGDRGRWILFSQTSGQRLVSELAADRPTTLALTPGRYLVRHIAGPLAAERSYEVAAGTEQRVSSADLETIPFRHAVRKGYGQVERHAFSLGLAFEAAAPLLDGTGGTFGGAVSGQLDFANLAVTVRLRLGYGARTTEYVKFSQRVLGLDLGLYHLFDLGPHGLGFGMRLGVDWLAQSVGGEGPDIDQAVPHVGPVVRAELALSSRIVLLIDLGLDAHLVEIAHDDGSNESAPRLSPATSLGFAIMLP